LAGLEARVPLVSSVPRPLERPSRRRASRDPQDEAGVASARDIPPHGDVYEARTPELI